MSSSNALPTRHASAPISSANGEPRFNKHGPTLGSPAAPFASTSAMPPAMPDSSLTPSPRHAADLSAQLHAELYPSPCVFDSYVAPRAPRPQHSTAMPPAKPDSSLTPSPRHAADLSAQLRTKLYPSHCVFDSYVAPRAPRPQHSTETTDGVLDGELKPSASNAHNHPLHKLSTSHLSGVDIDAPPSFKHGRSLLADECSSSKESLLVNSHPKINLSHTSQHLPPAEDGDVKHVPQFNELDELGTGYEPQPRRTPSTSAADDEGENEVMQHKHSQELMPEISHKHSQELLSGGGGGKGGSVDESWQELEHDTGHFDGDGSVHGKFAGSPAGDAVAGGSAVFGGTTPAVEMRPVGAYKDVVNKVSALPYVVLCNGWAARARETALKEKLNELQHVRKWLWRKQAGAGVIGVVGGVFTLGAATLVAAGGGVHQRNRLQQVKKAMRQVIQQINEVRSCPLANELTLRDGDEDVQIVPGVFTKGIEREELCGEL